MNKLYKEENIQAIGNAIREKGGTTSLLKVEDMAQAIADIPEPTGTQTVTENGTYNISTKKYVAVDVPQTGIEPTGTLTITQNGTYNIRNYEYVNVNVEETPERPDVPQTGTWQLKTTNLKKYVMLGTDDDNVGNAKFFRLLRTYNMPYVMNVEAENLNANLGNDIDDAFTNDDAPSLFAQGVNVTNLGKYLEVNHLGEVAQHGSSLHQVWNSTTVDWSDVYTVYTSGGGTKTQEELKTHLMNEYANEDVAQGASYVMDARLEIESAMGFFIDTVGMWGGTFTPVVDGVTLSIPRAFDDYGWRAKDYTALGSKVGNLTSNNTSPYDITRDSGGLSTMISRINNVLEYGHAVEFFWHQPMLTPVAEWRTYLTQLQSMNDVSIITRKDYAKLGEYVSDDNAIASISISFNKDSYTSSDTPNVNDFTVTITYKDGHTGSPLADKIIDLSSIDVSTSGTYIAVLYYRGFKATCNVVVVASSIVLPSDVTQNHLYYEIAQPQGSAGYYLIASTGDFVTGTSVGSNAWFWHFESAATKTVNTYVSNDLVNWTPVVSNVTATGNLKLTNTTYWGGYVNSQKTVTTIVPVTQA